MDAVVATLGTGGDGSVVGGGQPDGGGGELTIGGVERAVRELAEALGRTVYVTEETKPELRSFLMVK